MKMEGDEFDIYFEKAAALQTLYDSIRQSDDAGDCRRGSLPGEVITQVTDFDKSSDKHRRAFSCKVSRPESHGSNGRAASPSPNPGRRGTLVPNGGTLNDGKRRRSSNNLLSPNTGLTSDPGGSSSSPSRSSSFMRISRPRSMRDFQEVYGEGGGEFSISGNDRRRNSVNLEETVAAKLDELQRLDADDCCVVRNFVTSPSGLVNRGDSFRRKSSSSSQGRRGGDDSAVNPSVIKDGSQDTSQWSDSLGRVLSREAASRVLILGDKRVGKTALLTQFMTSEYLAALDSSFENDVEKTISVHLDDVESLLSVIEIDSRDKQDFSGSGAHCFVIVYSITERPSFHYATEVLRHLSSSTPRGSSALLLVANKSDLVRKRQISENEAKDICDEFGAKYIEVSAALNHKIDELLVGIVTQIRLRESSSHVNGTGDGSAGVISDASSSCVKAGPKGLLKKLFFRHKENPRQCENLTTL